MKGGCRTLIACALSVAGCCSDPWSAYPESTMPDRSCSTGDVHGHDVYIWECLRGERVVVAQYSAEMSCQAPVRDTAPCGSTTKLEGSLELSDEACSGPRSGREWKP